MSEQTPMMRQYARLKERYHDAILFFRLGDFYEMFRSDAEEGARLLGLTLTARQGVPMCGVPYHSAKGYIAGLLAAGRKVAICEQTKIPAKGLAERDVVEVITPGTVTEEDFLDRRRNNYIVALHRERGAIHLCYADVSTGELVTSSVPADDPVSLRSELARIDASELIVQQTLVNEDSPAGEALRSVSRATIDRMPDWHFDTAFGFESLTRHFGTSNMKGFGYAGDEPELAAAGVVLQYLHDNAGGNLAHIRSIERRSDDRYVVLDESTQVNLELVEPGPRGGYSLRDTIDETCTPMGSRLLARHLLAPLTDPVAVSRRLDAVGSLYHSQSVLTNIRGALSSTADLERLSARVAMQRAHAKDLKAVGRSLSHAREIAGLLESMSAQHDDSPGKTSTLNNNPLRELSTVLHSSTLHELSKSIDRALLDSPSTAFNEGGMFRPEYDRELSRLYTLQGDSRKLLDELLEKERDATGLSSLKLKHNRVIGYFFEVPKSRARDLPDYFRRRQSMSNAERYTTDGLFRLEQEIVGAFEQAIAREQELFEAFRDYVAGFHTQISDCARAMAELDVYASHAYTATLRGYVRPEVDDSVVLEIDAGRHPVVEAHLPEGEFVPNSVDLGRDPFVLLTGPNMAGKSTFLRQSALIVLLAQCGAFVPAERARVGAVDRIFCRVGASDNLARGESTFLVEMNETANILRFAGTRSLVIMDEVGRGTGTVDGISIAQAVTEYLVLELGSRTLFATHYHELTSLELPGMRTMRMAVSEEAGEVVFLMRVEDGPSHRSYGIHVARLAGLPAPVIQRANELLLLRSERSSSEPAEEVPASDSGVSRGASTDRSGEGTGRQPDLFAPEEWLPAEVQALNLDRMTPVEALSLLDQWKRLLSD
ncbi:MAG: DNA mismatch repair protein MutS [Spirochaetales bacterium]